jgi:hypothetical protein
MTIRKSEFALSSVDLNPPFLELSYAWSGIIYVKAINLFIYLFERETKLQLRNYSTYL